jgi:SAM-dependent methyltransferase
MTTPFDYDRNPERFRLATEVTQRYLRVGRSLYSHLAELLAGVGARRILDIGCGEGALRAALPVQLQSRAVGLDASWTMLGAHPRPVVQAHAAALPFAAGVFDAAVAVNVLDHLDEPAVAIAEAHRVLVAGGQLIAATASRHDAPELAEVWRPPPSSFDAENAPDLMAAAFEEIQVERWDAPLVRLPDRDAVRDYLIARFIPPELATDAAGHITTPATITKRGALIQARKAGSSRVVGHMTRASTRSRTRPSRPPRMR